MFLSALYQMGLWGHFNVNIFSFLSPSQLIMGTLQTLIFTVASVLFGFCLGALVGRNYIDPNLDIDTKGGKPSGKYSRLSNWFNLIFVFLSIASLVVFKSAFFLFATVPIISILLIVKAFDPIIEKFKLRRSLALPILIVVSALPLLSYSRGSIEGAMIVKGISYQAFEKNSCRKRFIGRGGDYFFYYDSYDDSVNAVPSQNKKIAKIFIEKNGCKKWEQGVWVYNFILNKPLMVMR